MVGHDRNTSWSGKHSLKNFHSKGAILHLIPKELEFSEIFIYLPVVSEKVEGISREDKYTMVIQLNP